MPADDRAVRARGSDPPEPPGAPMGSDRQADRPHRATPAVGSDPDPPAVGQQTELTSQGDAPSASPDPGQRAGQGGAAGPRRDRSTRTDPVAWLIALAAFLAYDVISVFKYLRLDPGSWD